MIREDRQDVGDVEYDAEEVLSPQLLPGEDGRKHQCKCKGDDGDHHHQQDHVLHRADELRVVQQLPEVFQPYEGLVGGVGATLIQRHTEHVEGGQDHENKEQDGGRCNAQHQKPLAVFIFVHLV